MEVTFMGTGTSQGVPMIACDCGVCTSADPRNHRTRTSIHVVMDGLHIQVDAAPEFRLQCLRNDVRQVDVFILTHGHSDHIAGMDDLRRFCDLLGGEALRVYSSDEGMSRVLAVFPYAIMDRPVVKGYPAFKLEQMPEILELHKGPFTPRYYRTVGSTRLGSSLLSEAAGRDLFITPIANGSHVKPSSSRVEPMCWCSMLCVPCRTPRTSVSKRPSPLLVRSAQRGPSSLI